MAGHSHWANISFKKGIVDKKRGKLFGKLARYIIVAARRGGGDPAANLALRYAIDRAKKASMPNDTIERAVKKGTGELETETYDEVLYEGYGSHGVAILCEILTENRNRTAGEVRKLFEVNGGNLGSTGCVAWMFERKGVFVVSSKHASEERLFEVAFWFPNDVAACGGLFAVFPRFLAWMGAFAEGVGRVALLLELCVRPFAVLIACTMVVAMFFQQWRGGLWNMLPALGFAWVMLDTMVPGAGPISLDAFLSRRWDK